MRRGGIDPRRAQRPRRLLFGMLLTAASCSNSGDPRGAVLSPSEAPERTSGCIDTPFVGPDHRTSTVGVRCGRERSPAAGRVRGRVVAETSVGLPGAGVEGLWVSVHRYAASLQLARLPAAQAETRTDPQGAFAIGLGAPGEYLVAVRAKPDGPVLIARRIVVAAGQAPAELLLVVPHEPPSATEQAAPNSSSTPDSASR